MFDPCTEWHRFLRCDTWHVFTDPNVLRFFGEGLLITLQMSAYALVLSFVLGIALALARHSGPPPVRWPATAYIEGARSLPVLLLIIVVNFLGPKPLRPLLGEGFELAPFWAGVIGLTIYTSAVLAEIVRAGIASIPRGQWDAGRALALGYPQLIAYIILPQALRRMVPVLMSQLTTLIKDTSLAYVIAVQELLRRGTIFYSQYFNPIVTLFLIACVYFAINFTLSRYSRRFELRAPAEARIKIQEVQLRDQVA